MAKQKSDKTKDKAIEIPTNSKGFRKSYESGVVGWQVYLQSMRYFVNVNQYGSAISADKKLIDYTLDGIKKQRAFLEKEKVKIPARLASRLTLAEKSNHPSFSESTADFAKGLRKLVDLYDVSDNIGKGLIKTACKSAVKSDKAKITNRLRKRIADMS